MENQSSSHCPLCGQPNQCAIAQTDDMNTNCWCEAVAINPATLTKIANETQNDACLCFACAQKIAASEEPISLENYNLKDLGILH